MPVTVSYSLIEAYRAIPGVVGPKPFLPVRLQVGDSHVDTWALIDSGADQSLFHEDWARAFGLDLQRPSDHSTVGIGGESPVWFFDMQLWVLGKSVQGPVGFSPGVPRAFGLLGRADFFSTFSVGFDHKHEQVLLEPAGN